MSSILFYTSIKTRVKDQESLMREFVKQGHKVFFLNQQPNQYLPSICRGANVTYQTISNPALEGSIFRTVHYVVQLILFVWKNNIELVYSHLEPANFIAVLTQYFVRAKIIIVRHHHDLAQLAGFAKDRSYRLTYQLAKKIITVSASTKRYMVEREGVEEGKIRDIALGYDFTLFGSVSSAKVDRLRQETMGKISLVAIGRLDRYKRPDVSIQLVKRLSDLGVQSHLRLLGDGDLKEHLEKLIKRYNLEKSVEFVGYSDDVLTYLKASDWLIHPSISESSCVVIKEAGLVETPIIVCAGVGDVDEYLVNGQNSMLVSKENFVEDAAKIIMKKENGELRNSLGKSLHQTVLKRFSISSVVKAYDNFVNS